mgnify:CR=1 FL=1
MLAMWAVHKSKAHRCVTDVVDQLVFEKQKIASARAAPVGIEALPAFLAGVADNRRRLSTERKWQVACFGLPVSRVWVSLVGLRVRCSAQLIAPACGAFGLFM